MACDHLGSPRAVVDMAGNPVKIIEYDGFGRIVADSNIGWFPPIGFAGGINDRATDLVRSGMRDYDARSGRWTARDPMLFGAHPPNAYAYGRNAPQVHRDSTGRAECSKFNRHAPLRSFGKASNAVAAGFGQSRCIGVDGTTVVGPEVGFGAGGLTSLNFLEVNPTASARRSTPRRRPAERR